MKLFPIIAAVLLMAGCHFYDIQKKDKSEYAEKPGDKISQVVFESGESVQFDGDGGQYANLNNCIAGVTYENRKEFIFVPVDNIKKVQTSSRIMSLSEFLSSDTANITAVQLNNDNIITFRQIYGGGRYYKNNKDIISGFDSSGRYYLIGTDSISYLYISKRNELRSCLGTLGIGVAALGAVVLIVAATKSSCPFIYSFDGKDYVFDKEPLGGATASILQRTDLSKLNFLKESDGKYKLMVTNEVDETQYVDKLKLTYVDHKKGESVYPDISNNLYLINKEILPAAVSDEMGKDLMPFFKSDDGIYWQSKMAVNSGDIKDNTRNEIYLSFVKPKGVDHCNLIINAGTTLWGSNMIKEMLLLYGSGVDDYYSRINKGGDDFNSMMSFLQKEELYQLKLYAKVKGEWKYKTTVNGGGPFKSETRVYPIDISDLEGDTIMFKAEPPVGFWTFDYAAVDFDPAVHPESFTLNISKAVDNKSNNLKSSLSGEDKNYYSMPDTSSYFYAEFDAPKLPIGKERTIFAGTTGWYEKHLPKTGTPNFTQLLKFVTNPGSVVTYSNKKYIEWINRNKLIMGNK